MQGCLPDPLAFALDVADHSHELLSCDHDQLMIVSFLKDRMFISSTKPSALRPDSRPNELVDILERKIIIPYQNVIVGIVMDVCHISLQVV